MLSLSKGVNVVKISTNILSTRNIVPLSCAQCSKYSTAVEARVANTDNSLYPSIKPPFPPGEWGDISKTYAWYLHQMTESFKEVPNAKERLEKLAGENSIWMNRILPYDRRPRTLEFKQFVTNTHISNGLPDVYKQESDVNNDAFTSLKSFIEETLLEEHECSYKYKFYDSNMLKKKDHMQCSLKMKNHDILGRILQKAVVSLAPSHTFLRQAQIDEHVQCKAYWRKNGFEDEEIFAKAKWLGMLQFQLESELNWQLRTEYPLKPFVDINDEICQNGYVPEAKYSPHLGAAYWMQDRPCNVSGHWIGDPCEFNHLAVICDDDQFSWYIDTYGHDEAIDRSLGAALAVGFGTTVAQAHNQGFNWLLDMTYPICSQVVVTNGRNVRFAAYQLNTMRLWAEKETTRNILFVTEEKALYDVIENGQVKGLNDELCAQLLQMLMMPLMENTSDLRPHLPQETSLQHEPYINNIGEPAIERPKIGRFQYPRNAMYF